MQTEIGKTPNGSLGTTEENETVLSDHDGVDGTLQDLTDDKTNINHQQGQEQEAPGSDASIFEQRGCGEIGAPLTPCSFYVGIYFS